MVLPHVATAPMVIDPLFRTLSTTQNPLRTSVTIVFENKCSFSLIHPTKYCAYGNDVDPPSPKISPDGINTIAAKFEGGNGTKGMLCYQIGESSGPTNDPYYLLIMWKVKRLSQNKFYMCLYESREPPLSGNSRQRRSFYESMRRMYEPSYDESFLEGKKLRVRGTMSSNNSAKIKISLEDYTNVTISLKNNCSYSLINPTHYCNCGDISPPSPIISPGVTSIITAKFEGGNGTMGVLCYQIEGSYGPNNDPYYLIITWKMKRFPQSEFYMNFYESRESPLSGNREFFYESMHRSNNEGFLLEGKKLRVGGTITNNDSAEIKISLEDYTNVTISLKNNCSYSLINPTHYCNCGDISPPSPIISPGVTSIITAKFEGGNGTMGVLCYQIEGSYGPKNDPYYLIITWKMKRNSQSEFYMDFHESKESPLSGNRNQEVFFYESMHRSNNKGFHKEGKKLRVGGTITNNDSAEIKISLEDYTNVTISLKNSCSYSLINPTHYCNCDDISPPSPIISPGDISIITAKFEGENGTMGVLCYQIERSYGPKNDPYYLIITWKMKRNSQSEFYMDFHESKESPLSGNRNQKEFFYESMHRSNNKGFHKEGKKLRVGGTITNNDSAETKIFLEIHKLPKKRLLRKIRSFLTKKFRKKKAR